jgi:hypothetical protein
MSGFRSSFFSNYYKAENISLFLMVRQNYSSQIIQKNLAKIFSAQLFFSLLFGGLMFWMFIKLGRQFVEIITVIFSLKDFASHEMATVILASIAFIVTCFLVVYTVGNHFGMKKKFSTTIVGMLATSALCVMIILVTASKLLIPILFLSLMIAIFGFHSSNQIHESLQISETSTKKSTKKKR